uniref:Uncharacterized protein n=1 Tax=Trichuris muris TaxID=70415 RepID=A0A5S6QP04_TRIMR
MSVSRKARLIRQRLEDFSEANLNIKSMPAFKRKAAAVNNTMETGALCFGVENVCDLLASKRYAVRSIFLELGKCTKEDEELLLKINKIARQYDADVNVVGCSRANASAHSSAHEGVYARLVPVRFDGLPLSVRMPRIESFHPKEAVAELLPFFWVGGVVLVGILSLTCSRWRKSRCCKKKEDSEVHVELDIQSPGTPGQPGNKAPMSPESPADKHLQELVKPKQGWFEPKGDDAKKPAKVKSGAKDYETMVNIGSDIWNPK